MAVGEYLAIGGNAQLLVEVVVTADFGIATTRPRNMVEMTVPWMDRLTLKPKLAMKIYAPLVSMFWNLRRIVFTLFDKYTLDTKLHPNIVTVNGDWGAWASQGSCSRTCGGGQQEWKRECDDPAPEHGGAKCTGDKTKIASCKTCTCPRNNILVSGLIYSL